MSLKQWLDDNPMKAAISIAISAATLGAGVTGYFAKQATDRLEHENGVVTRELEARLAGIERRVGSEPTAFFDVSRLVIPASGVAALGPSYRNLGEGTVFVDVPSGEGWSYSVVSEFGLARSMIPALGKDDIGIATMSAPTIHLWRGHGTFPIKAAFGEMTFSPMVFVQIVDNRAMAGAAARFAAETMPFTQAVVQKLQARQEPAGKGPDVSPQARTEQRLSDLFQGHVALFFLNSIASNNLTRVQLVEKSSVHVSSVEKKGNVLYARSQFSVPGGGEGSAQQPTKVDEETFIVTLPTKTILVRTIVPSRDGRSDAFAWVTRFLAGLRIPLEQS